MLNRKMQPAAVPPQAAVTRSALKDRLLDPRTLISFGILAVVLFVVLTHVQFDYGESLRAISQVNVLIYALAFAAFYFSFVVRTIRWELLLRNTGESNRFGELFHIVILAWFANCVLPAKMGDFYRAYLLRQQTDVSGSKGLGTIFSERALAEDRAKALRTGDVGLLAKQIRAIEVAHLRGQHTVGEPGEDHDVEQLTEPIGFASIAQKDLPANGSHHEGEVEGGECQCV